MSDVHIIDKESWARAVALFREFDAAMELYEAADRSHADALWQEGIAVLERAMIESVKGIGPLATKRCAANAIKRIPAGDIIPSIVNLFVETAAKACAEIAKDN